MKNGNGKSNGKTAVKSNGNKAKATKPAKAKVGKAKAKKAAPKQHKRYFLFEQPISHIVHRLGKLGWKPSAAYNAIKRTKGNADVSPKATSAQIYSGRNRKPNDKQLGSISKTQLAQLTKLSLVGATA
jgi:hypothetical protein